MATRKKKTTAKKKATRKKKAPAKKKAPVDKGGRPPKDVTEAKISYETIEKMASIGLTIDEVGLLLGVHRTTIWRKALKDKKLADAMAKGASRAKMSIKRKLFQLGVEGGNVTALIWLSKNLMGWTDRQKTEIGGPSGGPVQVMVVAGKEIEF